MIGVMPASLPPPPPREREPRSKYVSMLPNILLLAAAAEALIEVELCAQLFAI